MSLSPGQIINNRYRIVRLLGQGGFGAVYRAWDTNLDSPRAIKENLEISPEAQRQFKREAQILDKLAHPHLPRVIDHFVIPGQGQYLVMDFVEGEDLAEKLAGAGGPLPQAQVLDWIGQVCDALSYLHSQNPPVIHRDVKPANIKIRPDGQAILVDFGIAKTYDPNTKTTLGARAVTPGYSPIEQYGRSGHTDARSDVYALGATLYNLLTGREPQEAPERNLSAGQPAPRALNPAIPAHVDAAILQAMEMLPERRFRSAAELKAALQAAAAPAPTPIQPVARRGPAPGRAQASPLAAGAAPASAPRPAAASRPPSAPGSVGATVVIDSQPVSPAARRGLPFSWKALVAGLVVLAFGIAFLALLVAGVGPSLVHRYQDMNALNSRQPPLSPDFTDLHGVPMMLIPAGEFQMGSQNGDENERPVHPVYLDEFYIDQFEVTNARYGECVKNGDCAVPGLDSSFRRNAYYSDPDYADFPVVYVNWDWAQAYCEWRGARLPSEAEWEKAARGGQPGRVYPWGDAPPDCTRTNFYDSGKKAFCVGDTRPVGSYPPNDYGLYDMAGNVFEWTADRFDEAYYQTSPAQNPAGPGRGDGRVMRGGSWNHYDYFLRAAFRTWATPSTIYNQLGLRCARTP